MAQLLHSFVSGGSNNMWDAILPTSFWDARDLIVGNMCLHGHIEAKPFSDTDEKMLRKLLEIKQVTLSTPNLVIKNPRRISEIPETDVVEGGVYHLTTRICVYGYSTNEKPSLGIYEAVLYYIPATTNTSKHMLELRDQSGHYIHSTGYSSDSGQFFYFEVAKIGRTELFAEGGIEKLLSGNPDFSQLTKIIATASLA